MRRTRGVGIVEVIVFGMLSLGQRAHAADSLASLAPDGKPILEVAAAPAHGFQFPYILYVPGTAMPHPFPYLVVEMNNTPDVSNNIHELSKDGAAAVHEATSFSLANGVAERLGAPLLIPIFPRPVAPGGSDIYTFALSRDALLLPEGPLHRVDLQLAAMTKDARARLATRGIAVGPQIMLTGFSASAMFASRFVLLHPELVKAAAFGAVNAFFMLPLTDLSGHRLNYPLGLADFSVLTGHAFDYAAYSKVPEFTFMGANDGNDAVVSGGGDAYSAADADLIFSLFGRQMMPDRWQALERAYRTANPNVTFHTYGAVGHGLDERITHDVSDFLRRQGAQ